MRRGVRSVASLASWAPVDFRGAVWRVVWGRGEKVIVWVRDDGMACGVWMDAKAPFSACYIVWMVDMYDAARAFARGICRVYKTVNSVSVDL